MKNQQQYLYDFCNRRINSAVKSALDGNALTARAQLFEALDALKVLDFAEKNDEAKSFYRAKAEELLDLATRLRTEGCSEAVMALCRKMDSNKNYISSPAARADYAPPAADITEDKKPFGGTEVVPPLEEDLPEPPATPSHGGDILPQPLNDGADGDFEIPFADKPFNKPQDTPAPAEDGSSRKTYDAEGTAMRPQKLSDFLGQPQAVVALQDPINKARLSGTALQHVLLFGSHGLGKTTLAKIIANEMGAGFIEINNARTLTAEAAIQILGGLKEGDVVFIDEVHNITEPVASGVFYPAMEDFCVNYVSGKGKFTKTVTLKLPRFTVIGATTEAGKLAPPFKDRFLIHCHLCPYSESVLANIALNSFRKLGVNAPYEVALEIANRSRSTPRIVNSYVSRIADKAIVRAAAEKGITGKGSLSTVEKIKSLNVTVTPDLAKQYFEENGIDRLGLRDGDRTLLKVLIEKFNGGPAGQENLAKALNESVNVIAEEYESYLLKIGFINVLSRGRIAMPAAYRYLGLKVPEHILNFVSLDDDGSNKETKGDAPAGDGTDDVLEYTVTVTAEKPERREKIDALITSDGAETVIDETLDARFPDMERTYESAAKNISTVTWINGGLTRKLYCDSKLERRFIAYLSSCGYIKDIKTQCCALEYQNENGTSKLYYPDFFLLTSDGKIVIVEMKNVSSMSNHLNIAKYGALKKYAAENGYGYAEIGKDEKNNCYISVEQLAARPENTQLKEYILQIMEKREKEEEVGYFDKDDYNAYLAANPQTDPLDIHVILLRPNGLKNTDRTGDNLKIVKR